MLLARLVVRLLTLDDDDADLGLALRRALFLGRRRRRRVRMLLAVRRLVLAESRAVGEMLLARLVVRLLSFNDDDADLRTALGMGVLAVVVRRRAGRRARGQALSTRRARRRR